MWTIEKVKDEMPDVRCRFGDKVYDCHISGRKCQFAKVWAKDAQYLEAEFAWDTIANALNAGHVLLGG